MNSALKVFPYFARAGGWVALAGKYQTPNISPKGRLIRFWGARKKKKGTHFHFIREIPVFARYEVRSQIIGWNSKWVTEI
jgi:hypothetical protein